MIDAISIGDAFEDIILSGFASLPKLGEEGWAEHIAREVGGGAPITACGLAQLGLRSALISCVGATDSTGLVARLRSRGVDTSLMQFEAGESTATSVAISTRDDRMFYSHAGANRLLRLDAESIPPSRVVHFACRPDEHHRGLIRALRKRGAFVTLDPGWHPDWLCDPSTPTFLREIDLLFINDREVEAITGEADPREALRAAARLGLTRMAVKCGPSGAWLAWNGAMLHAPAQVVQVAETTGAGDCFNAGFLAGWLAGWPPERNLSAGVFCGSMSTRKAGGLAGFPTRLEFDEWVRA